MTQTPKTYVNIVLDRSGSMKSIQDATVEMFNEQVETIREMSEDQDVLVSLTTFSSEPDEPDYWLEHPSQMDAYEPADYNPAGSTALYDTIGETIEKIDERPDLEDEDTAVLFIVLTDGRENNSTEYTEDAIAELIEEKQETGYWTFTFLTAEHDVEELADLLNLKQSNVTDFEPTKGGMSAASGQNASSTESYMEARAAGQTQSESFYDEDEDEN